MADLEEEPLEYPQGIRQHENEDPVTGGPPNLATGAGLDNVPLQQLAKRTRWLRNRIETVLGYFSGGKIRKSALPKVPDADKLDGRHGAYYANVPARLGYTPMNRAAATDFTAVGVAPWHPEVETPDHRLAVTVRSSDNAIILDADQTWIWRAGRRIAAGDMPERIFATRSSKSYHLRWHAPGTGIAAENEIYPEGRLELADMVGEVDSAAEHDTTYDRMLIAQVRTANDGTATVTPLANAARLHDRILATSIPSVGPVNNVGRVVNVEYDWARRPALADINLDEILILGIGSDGAQFSGDDVHDHDMRMRVNYAHRYRAGIYWQRDYASEVVVALTVVA